MFFGFTIRTRLINLLSFIVVVVAGEAVVGLSPLFSMISLLLLLLLLLLLKLLLLLFLRIDLIWGLDKIVIVKAITVKVFPSPMLQKQQQQQY